MKKTVILIFVMVTLLTITGCSKKNTGTKTVTDTIKGTSYTCVSEGEAGDGGSIITKLVVIIDNNNYIVEHQIINDNTFKTKEMYESSKNATESNAKQHNESSSANLYKWTVKTDDKKLNVYSVRTYNMSGVRDSQGKKYDSLYNYFNEDGTYNAEGWMAYNRERLNGGYTCSKD